MFVHTFLLRFQLDADESQKARVLRDIRALQGQIPGLLSSEVGMNVSPRGKNFELGGVMHFNDSAAFDAYNTHPVHQALLQSLGAVVAEAIECDFDPISTSAREAAVDMAL